MIIKLFNPLLLSIKFYTIGKKIIEKEKIDLIYSYEVDAIPAGYLLSKKYNIPFVRRFQGTILRSALKNHLRLIKKYEHALAFLLQSDLTVMNNDGTGGYEALEFFKNDMKKVKYWRNGIEVPKTLLSKSELGRNFKFEEKCFNIITVSRLEDWKRIDRAINAVFHLKRLADKKFMLNIIGDGGSKEKLIELTKKLNLEKEVNFIGSVSHDYLKYYYLSADLFLSTNDISNVGNPLLEALSYGKPIITLDNGDTGEVIKNYENGILVGMNEIDSLHKKILEIMENNELRKMLEKNARNYALKYFWTWAERMSVEIQSVEAVAFN
jgi:glycosyltransferase involved in cell wall biosynthesis